MTERAPITPQDVLEIKRSRIPPVIFTIFNEEIINNWDGNTATATFYKDEIVEIICKRLPISSKELLKQSYLTDIVEIYNNAGWSVNYATPNFGENWRSYFFFSKANKSC